MDLLTFVRFTLTAVSGFLFGYVLFVAWSYMRLYARAPRDWRKLFPLHVWTVAVSYVMLVAYATIDMVNRTEATEISPWRIPVLFVADTLGIIAMYTIDRLRRARVDPSRIEEP